MAKSFLFPAMLALTTFILARELLKTLEDLPGDRAAGRHTLAVRIGIPATLGVIAGLAICLFVVIVLLFRQQGYALAAIGLMLVGVSCPLLYAVWYLSPAAPPTKVSHALALLKGAYFVGLLALWFA